MDIQTILTNAVQSARQEELKNSPQLLLGELILKLEAVKDKNKPLYIDLMDKKPMGLDSWRGSYCELAIQTEDFGSYQGEIEKDYGSFQTHESIEIGKKNPIVQEWIDVLKKAIGKTFTGYKGGDFVMGKNTPVWLAEYSNSSFKLDDKPIDEENYSNYKNVYFVDVEEKDSRVYLVTKIEDDQ